METALFIGNWFFMFLFSGLTIFVGWVILALGYYSYEHPPEGSYAKVAFLGAIACLTVLACFLAIGAYQNAWMLGLVK